ncbi:MAG: hypothetical protein KBT33_00260 [Prevotellaceae bacterium]|nr:hypothetical protein [Candidatus Minthosoma equi]
MAKKFINSTLLKVVFLAVTMMATTVSAWAQESVNVAKIGGTEYPTLEDAITAAGTPTSENPITIHLLNNVTSLTEESTTIPDYVTLIVASDKSIEFSVGNVKTLTISGNASFINEGTLTLTGACTITSLTNSGTLNINAGTVKALSNGGTLYVNSGTVTTLNATGTKSTVTAAETGAAITTVNVGDGVSTTISGKGYSNITGTGTINLGSNITDPLTIASGNTLTIDLCGNNIPITAKVTNEGTLTVKDTGKSDGDRITYGAVNTLENKGTITVKCTVSGFENSGTATVDTDAKVTTITNTSVLTVNGTVETSLTNNNGTVTINADVETVTTTGGTVTINEGKTVASLTATSANIVANGTVTAFVNSGETTISGTGVSTITGHGTIKLVEDITQNLTLTANSGAGFTLDLNGRSATGTITNAGKLEVEDRTAGAGTIAALTSGAGTETTIISGNVTTLTTTEATAKVNIKGEAAKTVGTLTVVNGTAVTFQEVASQDALQKAIELTGKSTIELGGDVSGDITIASGKNIILDPKGNNIDGTVSNAGTLELKDAGVTSGDPATTTYGTITALTNTGTLTVTEGQVTTLTNTSGATTINGGTLDAVKASDGTLNVTNGNITGTLTTAADNVVTVTGGTINAFAGNYIIKFPEVNEAAELTQALNAPKADIKLTGDVTTTGTFTVGHNATINVNAQSITNTAGNTFDVSTDGNLTITGNGNVNCGKEGSVAVNNKGTFTLNGPAVASATLNGTQQTVTAGTLTSATLAANKDINVTGGHVSTLTAAGGNTITTSSPGKVEALTANGNVTISGSGFTNLAGPTTGDATTITLASDVTSNLTVTGGKVKLALEDHNIRNNESQNTVTVNTGAELTISGTGNITNNNASFAAVENNGTTTLSGGTIETVKSTGGTLTVDGGAKVTTLTAGGGATYINGGSVANLNGTGTVTLLGDNLEMDLTVTGGSVTLDLNGKDMNRANKTVKVNQEAALTVKDSSTGGTVGNIENYGTTTVESGTVTALTSSGNVVFSGGKVTTLTAEGGTVTVNNSGITTLNANSGSEVTVTIDDETHKPKNLNVNLGAKIQIGSQEMIDFGTIDSNAKLTSALNLVKQGTLKLAANNIDGNFTVPAGSNITIDLNNHELTPLSGTAITAKGDVNITSSGTVSSVSVPAGGSFTLGGVGTVATLDNEGTTTVNNGTVTTIRSSTGTLNVNGGTVTEATATGTTNVSDNGKVVTLKTTAGTTTISGGTVTKLDATGSTTVNISDGNVGTATAGKKMTVSGGTIGTLKTTASTAGDDGGLAITAGTITTLTVVENSKANVSGGSITTLDVADANLTVATDGIVTKYTGNGGANVKLPSYTITDETAGYYPGNFKATTAKYTRTTGVGTQNKWGTACLPFDFTYNNHNYVVVYKVENVDEDKLNLTEYDVNNSELITAGTPFVFHIIQQDSESSATTQVFSASNTNVDIDAQGTQTATGVNLVGVNEQKVLNETTTPAVTDCYYISDNTFHQALKKLTVPKYRAYVQITTSNGARPRTLSLQAEDMTGINALLAEDSEIIGYYDLNGICHDAPQKGMNIVRMKNGKSVKMMIK